jgi:hypothetical protein
VCVADSLLVAYRQLVTAASSAARQHGPSVFGLHAFTKSVRLGALAIIRLKGPFWHIGLRSARNARSEGASFDEVSRQIQYNKWLAPTRLRTLEPREELEIHVSPGNHDPDPPQVGRELRKKRRRSPYRPTRLDQDLHTH